jgi:hypothetical protein
MFIINQILIAHVALAVQYASAASVGFKQSASLAKSSCTNWKMGGG